MQHLIKVASDKENSVGRDKMCNNGLLKTDFETSRNNKVDTYFVTWWYFSARYMSTSSNCVYGAEDRNREVRCEERLGSAPDRRVGLSLFTGRRDD